MVLTARDHARNKWVERGDPQKSIHEGWRNGIRVEAEGYSYSEARLDPDSGTIILCHGDELTTVLTVYDTVEYEFIFEVVCVECGQHHHRPDECPQCGSSKWMCN